MSSQPDKPAVEMIAGAVRSLQGADLPPADRHDAVAGAIRAVAAVERAARKLLRWDAVARPDAELMRHFATVGEGGDAGRS